MDKNLLYRKAYRILKHTTPLKFDCGLLCGSKCCSGDSDAGMHLYPGEECMYELQKGFIRLREESFNNILINFAVCSGKCTRNYRPLSCRIFPLVPYLSADGRLYIIEDPRAYYQCPLLFLSDDLKISGIFKRKIRDVFNILMQDPDINNYIRTLSTVLKEYSAYTGTKLPGSYL